MWLHSGMIDYLVCATVVAVSSSFNTLYVSFSGSSMQQCRSSPV
jgi:hypothetical protein